MFVLLFLLGLSRVADPEEVDLDPAIKKKLVPDKTPRKTAINSFFRYKSQYYWYIFLMNKGRGMVMELTRIHIRPSKNWIQKWPSKNTRIQFRNPGLNNVAGICFF